MSASSGMQLQFLVVRTDHLQQGGDRNLALQANESDTVNSIQQQIQEKTGLPPSEQRLIYVGRQLQPEQTLAECGITNDSTLFLDSPESDIYLPDSHRDFISETANRIKGACATAADVDPDDVDSDNSDCTMADNAHLLMRLQEAHLSIKSQLRLFLDTAARSPAYCCEYMKVFKLTGATSAIVIDLLVSSIRSNRKCAKQSITLVLKCSQRHMPILYAPLMWDFFQLLQQYAIDHPLFSASYNALDTVLSAAWTPSVAHFEESTVRFIIQECAAVTNKFSISLHVHLQTTALESPAKAMSTLSCFYIKLLGEEFAICLRLFCRATEGIRRNRIRSTVASSFVFGTHESIDTFWRDFAVTCPDGDGNSPSTGDHIQAFWDSVEVGSETWVKGVFYILLHGLASCLKAVDLSCLRPGMLRIRVASFIFRVMCGLHSIALFYYEDPQNALNYLCAALAPHVMILNQLINQSRFKVDKSSFWLLDCKSLLNFESRKTIVMTMIPKIQRPRHMFERTNFVFPRGVHMLSRSFEGIAYACPINLKRGISVKFESEYACGPGVLREWFLLISREIFSPQNALFKCCPSDRRRVFPNPASRVNCGHLTYFRFCGRIIALALMHNVVLGVTFSLAFFKHLSGLPISWQDIKDADPELYESCRQILEMDVQDIDSNVLGLSFVCQDEQQLGVVKTIELCCGGEDVVVNSTNRLDYVKHLVRHRFVTSVAEQVRSFSQGFSDLMCYMDMGAFVRGLEAKDFDFILQGSDQVIDLEDWKQHTEYHDYSCSDKQIQWFWQALEEMTNEERQRILFFSTSIAYLPIDGFRGLQSKFHICKGHDPTLLPTSHTCFFQLVLPCYASYSVMHTKLLTLTSDYIAEGFGCL